MATEDRPRLSRRVLALAGVAMAIAAIVLFAVGPGGGGNGANDVPEAGSKFRPNEDKRYETFLQALAPVLAGGETTTRQIPVEQAAAQVMAIGFEGGSPSKALSKRIESQDWGALFLADGNFKSAGALRELLGSTSRAARRAGHAEPIVLADPQLLPIGPTAQVEIGAGGTVDEVRADSERAGRRLTRAGIHLALGPSADLGIGGGPAEGRAFTDDPEQVATLTRASVQGFRAGGLESMPGRFPGEGAASQDPISGPATVGLTLDELVTRDLRPFASVVTLVPAVQMSAALFAAWDGVTPATLLPEAVELLRGRLGFRGAVLSSDLVAATAATGESVGAAAIAALKAGCDLLLVPGGRAEQDQVLRAITDAVNRRALPRARLDEAVARVTALRRAAT